MSDHEKILKLIETVDLEDSAAMDEIDIAVNDFLTGGFHAKNNQHKVPPRVYYPPIRRVTTSRDALKAIRPEGWSVTIGSYACGRWICEYYQHGKENKKLISNGAATEELSELYCIVAAIAWERAQ